MVETIFGINQLRDKIYMDNYLSRDEFLDKKLDYSPFLVHLTKDGIDLLGEPCVPAKDVLDVILSEKTLEACNHLCLFSPNLEESGNISLQDKFKWKYRYTIKHRFFIIRV